MAKITQNDVSPNGQSSKGQTLSVTGGFTAVLDANKATVDGKLSMPVGEALLSAEFERKGQDLIVHGESDTVLVTSYFNKEQAPALVSDNGKKLDGDIVEKLSGSVAPAQYAGPTTTAEAIGTVDRMEGSVTVKRPDGSEKTLAKGDPVFQDDIIQTDDGGMVGIEFVDGSVFTLGNDARMTLDTLVYDATTGEGESSFGVIKGMFKFVSGEIAANNPGDMEVRTPVATLGIRGTTGGGHVQGEGMENSFFLEPNADGTVGWIDVQTEGGMESLNQPNMMVGVQSFDQVPPPPSFVPSSSLQAQFGQVMDFSSDGKYETRINEQNNQQDGPDGPQSDGETPADAGSAGDQPVGDDVSAEAPNEVQQEQPVEEGSEEELVAEASEESQEENNNTDEADETGGEKLADEQPKPEDAEGDKKQGEQGALPVPTEGDLPAGASLDGTPPDMEGDQLQPEGTPNGEADNNAGDDALTDNADTNEEMNAAFVTDEQTGDAEALGEAQKAETFAGNEQFDGQANADNTPENSSPTNDFGRQVEVTGFTSPALQAAGGQQPTGMNTSLNNTNTGPLNGPVSGVNGTKKAVTNKDGADAGSNEPVFGTQGDDFAKEQAREFAIVQDKIANDPNYDPRLDPSSPFFDPAVAPPPDGNISPDSNTAPENTDDVPPPSGDGATQPPSSGPSSGGGGGGSSPTFDPTFGAGTIYVAENHVNNAADGVALIRDIDLTGDADITGGTLIITLTGANAEEILSLGNVKNLYYNTGTNQIEDAGNASRVLADVTMGATTMQVNLVSDITYAELENIIQNIAVKMPGNDNPSNADSTLNIVLNDSTGAQLHSESFTYNVFGTPDNVPLTTGADNYMFGAEDDFVRLDSAVHIGNEDIVAAGAGDDVLLINTNVSAMNGTDFANISGIDTFENYIDYNFITIFDEMVDQSDDGDVLYFRSNVDNNTTLDISNLTGANEVVVDGTGPGKITLTNYNNLISTADDSHNKIVGGTGSDSMIGGDGEDIFFGDGGNDSLVAGDGVARDELHGGSGDDTLVANDDVYGHTLMVGGDGADEMWAATPGGGMSRFSYVDLANNGDGMFDSNSAGSMDIIKNFEIGRDKLVLFDTGGPVNTAFEMLLTNTQSSTAGTYGIYINGADIYVNGWAGSAGGGYFTVMLEGANAIYSMPTYNGSNAASIVGFVDNQIIDAPADVGVMGTAMNMDYSGSGDPVLVYGNNADDTITGSAFSDRLFMSEGNDSILAGGGDDHIEGEHGDDYLKGQAGDDMVFGGHGADYINGGIGDDLLDGGYGDDVIHSGGGGGTDTIFGEAGDDMIYIDAGDAGSMNEVYGGEGDDIIHIDGGPMAAGATYDGGWDFNHLTPGPSGENDVLQISNYGGNVLDFATINNGGVDIYGMETIYIADNAGISLNNIDVDAVYSMTGGENILTIEGEAASGNNFVNLTGGWDNLGVSGGYAVYEQFDSTNGQMVTVRVDTDLTNVTNTG